MPRTKLTPEQVKEIRSRYGIASLHLQRAREAFDADALAALYGVTRQTVYRVASHECYDVDGTERRPH